MACHDQLLAVLDHSVHSAKWSIAGNIMAASIKIKKTLMKSVKSSIAKKPDSPADNLSPTQYDEVEKDDEEKQEDEKKALEEEREREFAQAKKDCEKARAMEREYTLFEKTAAPTRPALVVEPPLNITCHGKPINASVVRRSGDSRVESMPMNSISQQTTLFFVGIDKSPNRDLSLVVDSNAGAQS
ncbi:unnamed protein product [Cylicostephanus goldi]|uniref:Uncharacterized protein n=1 Tax=Cylicostephanus goldi TaxID=71465 RepID=A0A3P6S1T9_CYLGO|nr:unnamed protein product [Cylicostephanus goldi]